MNSAPPTPEASGGSTAATAFQNLFQRALAAHQQGDIEACLRLYPRAIAAGLGAGRPEEALYANYGALLREAHRHREAAAVYRRGLAQLNGSLMLRRNYGNLLLEEGQAIAALARFLEAEALLPADARPGKRQAIQRQQASALGDLGQPRLALQLLEPALAFTPEDTALRLGMADLWLELGDTERAEAVAGKLLELGLEGFGETFQQCNLLLRLGRSDQALERFESTIASHRRRLAELDGKTRQKYDTTCWNFALMLLRRGLLGRGWQLFEHGRRVPNGRGGMQRTVFKVHPARTLPEWDGSPLAGRRLLINGEQGIGDVLMFTMLVRPLVREAERVGIVTYDRLSELYRRSFPGCTIYDTHDYKQRRIDAAGWDVQIPIGSLPMLRYSALEDYDGLQPFLAVDPVQQAEFRARYGGDPRPLVGFSWKGGGNAKQKRTKSLRLDDFLPLFRLPGLRWISLQYGDVNDDLERFNQEHGLELLIPRDVDPLRDMDRWSALVACCDRVVSAANTTIHGAGCLGVPTWVILGRDPDWRWLGDPGTPCYWYPSVEIVRQPRIGSWAEPISELEQALAAAADIRLSC